MLVFEGASCTTCQEKINIFEQPTLRGSFKHVRYKVGAPSRANRKGIKRKQNKRSTTIQSGHVINDQIYLTGEHSLSQVDHPVGFIGLLLTPPKILKGITVLQDDPVSGWGQVNECALKAFAKAGDSIVYLAPINPLYFARFLAKIAFGYAYAELGNAFVPIIRPLIRGERSVFTDLVGGDHDIPPSTAGLHELQLFTFDIGLAKFQCVRIRLFAKQGTPNYHVVVGLIRQGDANYYENLLERQYIYTPLKIG